MRRLQERVNSRGSNGPGPDASVWMKRTDDRSDYTQHQPQPEPAGGNPVLRRPASKDLLVLHFTAEASAEGAFSSWVADTSRVATAYIVDRDGTIYETFDPAC
jgi:hypothetical protein